MSRFSAHLEKHQIAIYLIMVVTAGLCAALLPGTQALERAINPALALMLFVTFLQVPLAELRRASTRLRFLGALLAANFVLVPLLVAGLIPFLPADPLLRLGVLLVLLTPCIDYVVTFSHIGRADARLLLASTPVLLIAQMLLLPLYLKLFLGPAAAALVQTGPFLEAFAWLIAGPLVLALLTQRWAVHSQTGARLASRLGLLPVPATALVLFIIVVSVTPQLGAARDAAVRAVPLYIAFAVLAPLIGWGVGRLVRIEAAAGRALAFSSATRNSLVVLPLALAVPGGMPVLPAVIVTQTLVELLSSLVYMRMMPKLGSSS